MKGLKVVTMLETVVQRKKKRSLIIKFFYSKIFKFNSGKNIILSITTNSFIWQGDFCRLRTKERSLIIKDLFNATTFHLKGRILIWFYPNRTDVSSATETQYFPARVICL